MKIGTQKSRVLRARPEQTSEAREERRSGEFASNTGDIPFSLLFTKYFLQDFVAIREFSYMW